MAKAGAGKSAEKKKGPAKNTAGTRRRKKAPAGPVGLAPGEVRSAPPAEVSELCAAIEADGGSVLVPYREPLGGHWVILAALPLEQVEPTPYQRGLSEAHVKRLADVIARTGRYLDPVIAARVGAGKYQVPNGHHRVSALKAQGARSVTALVVTEPEVARLILALNVEKAHNLREKSLEAIKLARELAGLSGAREDEFALEFEEPAFLTLGLCYERNGRFGGGAYHPILKRVDGFLAEPMPRALEKRESYAARVLELDELVAELVKTLREQGLESPYLRNFIVARLNPLRFRRGATLPLEETLERMLAAARKFQVEKITPTDLARSGGAPPEAEG
ncbi:MAG: ParB N-terminal domain-containing protein [Planctomycetota bacterium]